MASRYFKGNGKEYSKFLDMERLFIEDYRQDSTPHAGLRRFTSRRIFRTHQSSKTQACQTKTKLQLYAKFPTPEFSRLRGFCL